MIVKSKVFREWIIKLGKLCINYIVVSILYIIIRSKVKCIVILEVYT